MGGPTSEAWIDPWIQHLKALGVQFHSTAPEPVSSVLGRPWRIVITLPDGPLAQYPDPLYADQVVGVVMTYDGVVHSQDQP
jgi:hypothetical protein